MSSQLPKASILINNYNYGKYLEESIDSALRQTYQNCEVIVVDDGSTDQSIEIVKSYQSDLISIFKSNGGQASAFNAGFSTSQGDFIFFLDSDDFFESFKVEEIISLFKKNPLAGWIFHELKYVDKNAHPLAIHRHNRVNEAGFIDCRHSLRLGRKLPYSIPCGLCFRREILDKILPMPESHSVTISDNYIKFAALGLSPGIVLNQRLASQRIHDTNIYTFKSNNQSFKAEIGLKTGYYLRERFPEIAQFANKVFVRGLGELIGDQGFKSAFRLKETRQFFQKYSSPIVNLQLVPRLIFHAAKVQLNKFIKP